MSGKKSSNTLFLVGFTALLGMLGMGYMSMMPVQSVSLNDGAVPGEIFQPAIPERVIADQRAGLPVVISVTAPWCITCQAQKPALEQLAADPHFSGVKFYRIDYSNNPQAYDYFGRKYGTKALSTVIVFKGEKKVAHSVGETDPRKLMLILLKAI